MHPVDLTGPRVPRGHRDGQPDLGEVGADVGGDRALADRGRAGEDDETGRRRLGVGRRHTRSKRAMSAAAWFEPSPRTRRDSEIPTSSMICRARTRPTPGRDSSRAETFILPMISLSLPSWMTSAREPCEYFSRFLAAARSRRARAAFARAAARCSGVSGGRATEISLGRADGRRRFPRTYPWPDSPRNDGGRAGGTLLV